MWRCASGCFCVQCEMWKINVVCVIHFLQGWMVFFSIRDCTLLSELHSTSLYIADWTDRGGRIALGKETIFLFFSLFRKSLSLCQILSSQGSNDNFNGSAIEGSNMTCESTNV